MIFSIEIDGTPCQIDVTHYEPSTPTHYGSSPDWAEEGWGGEICWDVLDMQGNPAPALQDQLTSAQCVEIEDQIEALYQELAEESRLP